MDGVLDEIRSVIRQGAMEVELLGQTVNAYRDSAGRTLADLLVAAARISGLRRLRFTTSHPAQMTPRLIEAMAASRSVVCPYLHLPVQSGSSRVLREMRRGYDREHYLETIAALRRSIPEISLGTDVIVGFPTETDEDFRETLSLLEELRFAQVYSFTYSPRPGTAALALGDPVSESVKSERLQELQGRQREIQADLNAAWRGREVEVLVEGPSKREGKWAGRTPENRIVHFEGPSASGRLEKLRIVETTPFCLHAEAAPSFA
jgi:tRNA-2-methylthio-N6-dimethylallyladenosine synthase